MDSSRKIQSHDAADIETTTPRLAVHCLTCGSDHLDMTSAPRGDEIVECFSCGDWNSYLKLELAEINVIRESILRKKIVKA